MPTTLYERLGGEAGLRDIANDVVDAHAVNPQIQARFAKTDLGHAKEMAFQFFAAGSGGPQAYTGRPLPEAHRGMNLNEQEFVAACDDVLMVLNKHGIGAESQGEVLGIFFALKGEVLHI
jgi:hemoglobin